MKSRSYNSWNGRNHGRSEGNSGYQSNQAEEPNAHRRYQLDNGRPGYSQPADRADAAHRDQSAPEDGRLTDAPARHIGESDGASGARRDTDVDAVSDPVAPRCSRVDARTPEAETGSAVDSDMEAPALSSQPALSAGKPQPDIHSIWCTVLEELNVLLSRDEFDTWVKDTRAVAFEDGELVVAAPTSYVVDWLRHRLYNRISWALRDIMQRTVHVTFVVRPRTEARSDYDELPLYGGIADGQEQVFDARRADAAAVPPASAAPVAQNRAPNQPTMADADLTREDRATAGGHAGDRSGRRAESREAVEMHADDFGFSGTRGYGAASGREVLKLNPTYTFDSFVVGNHNRMAHAAAEAVASDPGLRFNPLFVYGGVGLGKTHLLHAIGNRAIQQGLRALYCSSEMFTNELIQAIRSQSTQAFREKYRQVDILLIDDIQFIIGKESTQEEVFHTFNELYAADRHIVLSSDRPPKALATLEERLRSRFEGGLQTDISRPDFETRVAILQSKASRMGLSVSHDVLMLVAERVDSNVRELEGALNQLSLVMGTHRSVLTYDDAQSMLDSLSPNLEPCVPERVIELVGDFYGFSVDELTGKRRPKELSLARQVAMYLLREENGLTLPAIGALLGGRDHTTVRHGVKRIAEDLNNDRSLREGVMAIREQIYRPLLP